MSLTYAGYKKWRESDLYKKETKWTDQEMDALICNFKEFKASSDKEDQIRAKLNGNTPSFGNKKC